MMTIGKKKSYKKMNIFFIFIENIQKSYRKQGQIIRVKGQKHLNDLVLSLLTIRLGRY